MTTSYGYDNDRIENITHNGFSYNYEYDAWGNATSVKVGQQPLVNYSYGVGENRNRINRITYGNGDYIDYTYADNGNITAIKSYSDENTVTADYEYTYDENGNVSKIKNVTENSEVRYAENNTSIVLLNGEGETDDVVLYSTEMNEDGETIENLGGIMYTKGESTTSGDVEKGTTTLTSDTTSPSNRYDFISENDYFGRQTKRELSKVISDTNNVKESLNFQTSYDYKNYSGNRTSSLISSYRAVLNRATETVADETKSTQTQTLYDWEYLYTYDTNGNIVDLSVNIPDDDYGLENVSICSYVYDEAGQLVRENNAYTEKSYVYVYDKGGNITQKIEYEYSEGTLVEPLSTVNYTYDTAWKDKLTAYGDTSITADAIGNPLNLTSVDYLGNKVDATLEWNGRQLSAIIINGQRIEYTYDSSGMRTKMTVYNTDSDTVNTVYYYIWNNGKLLGYIVTDANGATEHTVKMLFDNTNDSVGYELYSAEDNTTKSYFFLKNLQGDITNVFNENGDDVLQYAYDAWGNVTAIFDKSSYENLLESAEAVVFTPITYRGYMYDQYSGLYYLQSRYYNPTYGRFINADSIMKIGNVLGANIFAYCENNPVNFADYDGRDSQKFAKIIVEIFTVLVAICAFVEHIFNDEVILGFSNYEKDKNGMYNMRIKYQNRKYDKKSLTVIFGGYTEWQNSKDAYNDETRVYFDYWGQIIEEENAKLGVMDIGACDGNYNVNLQPVFLSGINGFTLAYYGIKTIPIRKVFNAVWGESGLDPNNSLSYWAYRVTSDSQHNGSYAYSFSLDKWVEFDI